MSYRIKKYKDGERFLGFVVEVEKKKWYGKVYWTHFISVAGISSKPWYYSTYKYALDGLLFKVKCDTITNSRLEEDNIFKSD